MNRDQAARALARAGHELDPWGGAWCHCQASARIHAHTPGGLALVFPTHEDHLRARARYRHDRAVRQARIAMMFAALAVLAAVLSLVLIALVAAHG